jgi:succinyl-CoA synthetase beta subunit
MRVGKGTVTETGSRGVVLAKSLDEVPEKAKAILGGHLVTLQTKAEGKLVNKVYVAEDVYAPGASEPREFYMSVLLDRGIGRHVIVYSPDGGMNIEEVAEKTPERIFKEVVDPLTGVNDFQCRKIAFNLGLSGTAFKEMGTFVKKLYSAFVGIDAAMFEINPVLKTSDDRIIAVDAKVTMDGNGLFRHKEIAEMRDTTEEDPLEVEATAAGLAPRAAFTKAITNAKDVTNRAMFDYSSTNKPRYFQHPVARVVLQFKQFPQQMTFFLAHN